MSGVNHVAFVTCKPADTVHFYRDVLGLPLAHCVTAKGWGREDHPDFVHFFFDIGNGDHLAFFYYFGVEPYIDPNMPELLAGARHLALHVDSEEELTEFQRRLEEAGYPVTMRVVHETIESIYTEDPNGLMFEIARALRPLGDTDATDAELSVQALVDITSGGEAPTLARLWRRKAELIGARDAATVEASA